MHPCITKPFRVCLLRLQIKFHKISKNSKRIGIWKVYSLFISLKNGLERALDGFRSVATWAFQLGPHRIEPNSAWTSRFRSRGPDNQQSRERERRGQRASTRFSTTSPIREEARREERSKRGGGCTVATHTFLVLLANTRVL